MAVGLAVILAAALVVVMIVIVLRARSADPALIMGFAIVLAITGGAVLIGTTGDTRLLGGLLSLLAVVTAGTAVVARARG